ncbi:MAG TPA: phage holin family protein [Puia sp.]|jgi:putative membrane protein|nr:phage holin family protein [Puia sp.]
MAFIIRIIVSAIVAFGLSYILKGVHINQFTTALLLAVVLAVLNAIVKPILIILTLPITIITFGLFLFVINAIIILLASDIIKGFSVDGFWWALIFSFLLSIITSVLYNESVSKRKSQQ